MLNMMPWNREERATARSRSVLVVDDDPYLARAMGRRLEAEGFKVRTAADAWEGLSEARHGSPDLMVLDLRLPDRSGFELVQELIAEEDCPPVILITGDPDKSIEERAYELGVLHVFRKPCPHGTIVTSIRDLMNHLDRHEPAG